MTHIEHTQNFRASRDSQFEEMTALLLACLVTVAGGGIFLSLETELTNVIFGAIADAYIQVSTFVAATFLIIYGAEKFLKVDAVAALRRDTVWQVPVAAALGAMPGCGGAVIVVTQFVTGRLSFGGVVAALTATMGDAAFLLIAQEPITGLAMVALGFSVGMLSGWSVNAIHGGDFLRGKSRVTICPVMSQLFPGDWSTRIVDRIWMAVFTPGIVLAILVAFQVDADALLATTLVEEPVTLLGVVGGVLAVTMRLTPGRRRPSTVQTPESASLSRRVVEDTNFITIWVIGAFLVFELSVYGFGLDLQSLFDGWAIFTPLIAVLLGCIRGCGSQVLVTTMYLAGLIPLSAQIGNTISNDGDALFPAIAIAPKVAIVATLYSAVPALILAYGWMFWME